VSASGQLRRVMCAAHAVGGGTMPELWGGREGVCAGRGSGSGGAEGTGAGGGGRRCYLRSDTGEQHQPRGKDEWIHGAESAGAAGVDPGGVGPGGDTGAGRQLHRGPWNGDRAGGSDRGEGIDGSVCGGDRREGVLCVGIGEVEHRALRIGGGDRGADQGAAADEAPAAGGDVACGAIESAYRVQQDAVCGAAEFAGMEAAAGEGGGRRAGVSTGGGDLVVWGGRSERARGGGGVRSEGSGSRSGSGGERRERCRAGDDGAVGERSGAIAG